MATSRRAAGAAERTLAVRQAAAGSKERPGCRASGGRRSAPHDRAAVGDSGPAMAEPIREGTSLGGIPPEEMIPEAMPPESAALDSALPDRAALSFGRTSGAGAITSFSARSRQDGRGEIQSTQGRDPRFTTFSLRRHRLVIARFWWSWGLWRAGPGASGRLGSRRCELRWVRLFHSDRFDQAVRPYT